MSVTFVNREREMRFLGDIYNQKGLQLVILYGRKRVGKTEILKNFLKNKDSIYFLADRRGTESNAQRLAQEAARHFQDIPPDVHNLDDVFTYTVKRGGRIVAVDEFSYLMEKDTGLPSVFQLIVDEILEGDFLLILCGSSISMMERGTLSYKSPLYGRRAGQWLVEPFQFRDVLKFFPHYTFSQVVEAFSIVGGIPAYMVKFDDSKTVFENMEEKILRKGTFLYEEVEFLLRGELRDPSRYSSILEAIGNGATRVTEIAHRSRIPEKDLSKYLRILQNLHLVEKIWPITEKGGKKTIYRIGDQFFNFWFRFIHQNKSYLESEDLDYIMGVIKKDFNSFVGLNFERVCREALSVLNSREGYGFPFSKVGTWWGYYRKGGERKEIEIDIVALDEDTRKILFAECKWKEKIDAEKMLTDLKEKSEYVNWYTESRKEHFALFGRSFLNRPDGCLCFDIEDLENLLR